VEALRGALRVHQVGCLLWAGRIHVTGYPRLQVTMAPWARRLDIAAHRLVWLIRNGPINAGHRIIRTCGSRLCGLFDAGRLRRFDGSQRENTTGE
jgi:hypothetical protein